MKHGGNPYPGSQRCWDAPLSRGGFGRALFWVQEMPEQHALWTFRHGARFALSVKARQFGTVCGVKDSKLNRFVRLQPFLPSPTLRLRRVKLEAPINYNKLDITIGGGGAAFFTEGGGLDHPPPC